jgi:hypothetical protein
MSCFTSSALVPKAWNGKTGSQDLLCSEMRAWDTLPANTGFSAPALLPFNSTEAQKPSSSSKLYNPKIKEWQADM